MNKENKTNEVQNIKGNYFTGIIGAIIGGAIATIPWIFVYVKLNFILSILAMVIAFGALKGYEICKGKMTKSVKIIITVISILLVVLTTLVFIPFLLALEHNSSVNVLYASKEFMNALYRDLAISVFFAILGITASYPYINRKLQDNGVQVIDPEIVKKQDEIREIELNNKLKEPVKEKLKIVKTAFEELNALTPENAVSENEAIAKMDKPNAEKIFKKFRSKKIIVKFGNKYYYNKNNESNLLRISTKATVIITAIICISCLLIGIGISAFNLNNNNLKNVREYSIQNNSFNVSIPESWSEDPSNDSNITYLYSEDKASNITIISTKKEHLTDFNLEEYANKYLKDYLSETFETYSPKNFKDVEKINLGDYNAYTAGLEISIPAENSTNILNEETVNAYWIETENYFIEVYSDTLNSSVNKYNPVIKKVVNSIKEIKQ